MVIYLNNFAMTIREKKMKAVAIAVSCCMLNESEEVVGFKDSEWCKMGRKMAMDGREFIQRKGRDSRFSK